jgi:ketosteroid isomerase-like protein
MDRALATDGPELVERLRRSVETRDIDALVDCFAADYRNDTPVHPARGFTGREQVRKNWSRLFAGVADLRADVVRLAVDDDVVWSEWEMKGTRGDGHPHLMRGVIIFGIDRATLSWSRFYLEPVDADPAGVDDAIGDIVSDRGER